MNYTCNDIFMIRTPSLPVNVFTDFMKFEGNIEDFIIQNQLEKFFDNSILISSRGLYEAKERDLQNEGKKGKAKELSFIKFLIRSSTRPTPYGLFAGVALGAFCDTVGEKKALIVDEKKAIIECRVDHLWLAQFIYELENHPKVYPQLKLRFNNNCYVSGDRLKNPHYSNHGLIVPETAIVVHRNHMRNTPLISHIKQEAQGFVDYKMLKLSIQSKYPTVSEEKIVSTINMLMDNEILLTNLRVPSNCANGLEYVLKVLEPIKGIDKQKEDLQKVNMLINQINNERDLENIDAANIKEIYALLEGLVHQANEKDLLAVNKGIVLNQNKLPHKLKSIIENFIEGILCLQVEFPSKLDKFRKQFEEEYGQSIEVPLCDIIDQNNFDGLSYLEDDRPTSDEKDQKIKQIVDEKVLYCLQSQGEEVTLYKDDFSSIGSVQEENLSESFDANFFVTREGDTYYLTVAPARGSTSAGDMFNRFSHVLDTTMFNQYKENNRTGKSVDPDTITVEIREGTTKGRLGNINNHNSEHQYYIALATNDNHSEAMELSLDDLLIGMQNDRLYIKSKSQGKQCKIVYDCMINKKILSDVSKLLLYISSDQEIVLIPSIYTLCNNNYVFVPRILFEGVVVQQKCWHLPAHLFELKTLPSFTESLQMLRKKYCIDDIVYMCDFDNRLILDLRKDYSFELLYKHMQKNSILEFCELEKNVLGDSICLDTSGKNYISEISCSVVRSTNKESKFELDGQLEYQLQNENRALMPLQDGWVYAKLYHIGDRENEVLSYILDSLNSIGNPKFFYLRYHDNRRNLRVRFKYADEATAQTHFLDIQKLLISFREHKLINHVQFDAYFRENNRYGGSQLIELAENVFFADSLFVINLLKELNIEEESALEQAYLLGICTILTAFFDRIEDMLDQTNLTLLLDENKKIFRAKKQAYIIKIQQLLSRDYSDLSDQMISLIAKREEAIKKYHDKIVKTDQLTHSRENIIRSIIHMFCNRLRADWDLEQKFVNIIRESLSNIIEKNKRISKHFLAGVK